MERERRTRSSLRSAENLSLPQVQVIVISANMDCSHCRQRVSKLLSKMNRLLDYVVDFKKKQATVRGVVQKNKKRRTHEGRSSNKSKPSHSFGLRHCFGAFSSL
ncbi:uncharacterized protein LOC141839002 isoform X2 [Curcuma longa]|uniref:uncharacterized protein LOC141839002 isoform X2 n=1 Tax=Curcuma longa TaxID=136217 RepID=UPI003D9F4FF5